MRRLSLVLTVACIALAASPPVLSQGYPNKPIQIIAPYPPGGATDMISRSIGKHLQDAWHQPVIVENRPGNSGIIGATQVARSAPDGYTILIGSQALYSVNPILMKAMPYDANKDFTPITQVARLPSFFVVSASSPSNTFQEFVKYVKANPGKVAYGSAGVGTAQHIFMEMLKRETGMDMLHVAYKGSAPAIIDVVGGQVQAAIDFGPSVLPHIKSGKLKALAVSTRERSTALPNVPTLIESGVPDFDAATWFAVHGPGGMPKDVVERLSREINRGLQDPAFRSRLEALGINPQGSTPEELRTLQIDETVKWKAVIEAADIRLE